jgi:hypothetical protein
MAQVTHDYQVDLDLVRLSPGDSSPPTIVQSWLLPDRSCHEDPLRERVADALIADAHVVDLTPPSEPGQYGIRLRLEEGGREVPWLAPCEPYSYISTKPPPDVLATFSVPPP